MTTIAPLRTAALAAIAAIGAIVFVDKAVFKPSVSQAIANGVRRDLDSYNSGVDHEEEVINTSEHMLFDRNKILQDVKARKPWNQSYADKEMSARARGN